MRQGNQIRPSSGYHFASREGLIRALIEYRHAKLDEDREAILEQMRSNGTGADPRAVVWLLVRPLVNSIRRGQMFAPFLARLSEDTEARSIYWPEHVDDAWSSDQMEKLVEAALQDLSARIRRGRTFQLYNSVLNLLGVRAHRRSDQRGTTAQLRRRVGRDAHRAGMIRDPGHACRLKSVASTDHLALAQLLDARVVNAEFAQQRIGVLADGATGVCLSPKLSRVLR
ncbi:MAG: hypothetical protein ACLP9Y_25985 [Mycobacterium sp.]